MMQINLNHAFIGDEGQFKSLIAKLPAIEREMMNKTSLGSDFLGWYEWVNQDHTDLIEQIQKVAAKVRKECDVLLVAGIGGSYLGARSAIDLVNGLYGDDSLEIIYIGNTFSSHYLNQVMKHIEGKKFAINVISKSGTTTETAIAFRFFEAKAKALYGEAVKDYIYVTTDENRGILHDLATQKGYPMFVIPDHIGGRYSVITAVGLLPIACAGVDIEALMAGAKQAYQDFARVNSDQNPVYQYAAARHYLYKAGYVAEMFVTYEPHLVMLAEWWKQLFGESEGKESQGLLPTSANFSTDLHSLGQFIQEGSKVLFETVLQVEKPQSDIVIPTIEDNLDELNYLAGKTLDFVNKQAFEGTLEAHVKVGQVPNIVLTLDQLSAFSYGYFVYFMMRACALSVYLLDLNPFDQPGVEVYKRNMFKLLGKPGF